LLFLIVGCGLSLADKGTKEEPLGQKGLILHEWGIFRLHKDTETANADMRLEWDGLPAFVYGQMAGRNVPTNWSNVDVFKPVIYLHAQQPLDATLRVDFPGGMPAVWWPRTQHPVSEVNTGGFDKPEEAKPANYLEWRLRIKGYEGQTPPKFAEASAKHWFQVLRQVKADDVWVEAGETGFQAQRGGKKVQTAYQRERFVYYDGIPSPMKGVTLAFSKDKVSITNHLGFGILDVTVVDRRSPDHPTVARLGKLDAKAHNQTLEFIEAKSKEWPAEGAKTLLEQLTKTGLFEDEAKSLVDIWKQEFFQAEGISIFYRLSQDEYERLLPMTMKPKPEKLVRVGLVHQPHCEPDLADRIARLAKQLNDDDFQKREDAQKKLEELAGAAFGQLKRLREHTEFAEMQRRLDLLLEKHDAAKALRR
jgi:hypothetical protein